MADQLGTELSEEKEAEIELKKRQKRTWEGLHKSGKIGITPELPETLGFYDINPSLTRFICTELTRGYFLEHNEAKYTERRERVYTCMRIPKELEKVVYINSPELICPDFSAAFSICLLSFPSVHRKHTIILQSALSFALLLNLFLGCHIIDMYISPESFTVADRLFSSFGQDILDALYWTATEPKERKRDNIGVIPHFFMAVFYVCILPAKFVEIKGSVFKKFEKNNLFQMSNSDIKERFTSYVLLLIVCLRNMEQFSWNPDHLWVLFPDVFMVVTSEVAVDVIKHAFITKFNDITADVYSEYRASLAFDLVSSRQKNVSNCLLIRVVMSSVRLQGALSYTCVLLFYLGLVTLKVLNSIVLLGKSCVYVKRAKMEDKLFERPSTAPSSSAKSPSKIPATPCSPTSSSISSVTTQPIPRTDLFPPPFTYPSPEDDEDEEEEEEAQLPSETKHKTSKKDLLEIDRFTICGNRID
uniref:Transmembrane anterior posterior transformation protein 1 homolog n=1 Tax=Pundamilia nyererei TaxID=303518 RepID=A0A3B4ESG0_9CICH